MVYGKNHTLCDLLRWTLFTLHNSFGVLFCCVSVSCFFSPLTSTPQLGCAIVFSVLHPLKAIKGVSWFDYYKQRKLLWYLSSGFYVTAAPFLWDKCPRVQLLRRRPPAFQSNYSIWLPHQQLQVIFFSTPSPEFDPDTIFFHLSHSGRYVVVSHRYFNLCFPDG